MLHPNNNVLILTHWSYRDALVQTYTIPYVKIIRRILPFEHKLIVVTSEQPQLALEPKELENINRLWSSENMALVAMPYERMGIRKIIKTIAHIYHLYRLIRAERIETIHSFCTPAGSIGYLLSKLTGAQLIIDSYEPHAESMVENGTWLRNGLPFRILFLMEKLQTKHAKYLVSASSGMIAYAKEKYCMEPANFFVKPACVDFKEFNYSNHDGHLAEKLELKNKIVCVYAGKLGGIYLKAEIFDFLRECYNFWGERFRFLMLTNATREEVVKEMQRVGLPDKVVIQKFVMHSEVPRFLSLASFAINPVKPVPTKQYCTSIKDGEYWATGLPVVITKNISDDSEIIRLNNIGYVLAELSANEYRKAIEKINLLIQGGQSELREKIRATGKQYRSFEIAEKIYTTIYS